MLVELVVVVVLLTLAAETLVIFELVSLGLLQLYQIGMACTSCHAKGGELRFLGSLPCIFLLIIAAKVGVNQKIMDLVIWRHRVEAVQGRRRRSLAQTRRASRHLVLHLFL